MVALWTYRTLCFLWWGKGSIKDSLTVPHSWTLPLPPSQMSFPPASNCYCLEFSFPSLWDPTASIWPACFASSETPVNSTLLGSQVLITNYFEAGISWMMFIYKSSMCTPDFQGMYQNSAELISFLSFLTHMPSIFSLSPHSLLGCKPPLQLGRSPFKTATTQ